MSNTAKDLTAGTVGGIAQVKISSSKKMSVDPVFV